MVGTKVICKDNSYGNGEVVASYESFISVKFENKSLPILCNSKTKQTVHLDKDNIKFSFEG